MTPRPPTIDDVAARAAVSRSAVSRTFTTGASVAPATREKVLSAARALGYRPNLLARSLSTRRSRTVGIAAARLENPFNAQLLQALAGELRVQGYGVRLFIASGDADNDPSLGEITDHRVDAVIACAIGLASTLRDDCAALGVPVVTVNRRSGTGHALSILGDNRQGGACVARFLLTCGHQRFAWLGGAPDASTSRDREAGYAQTLAAAGAAPPIIVGNHWEAAAGAEATRALLARPDRPDALFCANDQLAAAAIGVAVRDFGLRLGRDLSVVGYDDVLGLADACDLSSFSQPIAAMATAAVAATVAALDGAASGDAVLPGRLVVRGSSRRPAGCIEEDGCHVWLDGGTGA